MPTIEGVFPVHVNPPIRVYPANETAFTDNGICCLSPQSAEVTLKEQQAHSLHMVHPVDAEGVWKQLKQYRILYVPIMYRDEMTYQPMRICKIQKQRQSGGNLTVTVDAKHVFYDLNSVMVRSVQINAAACQPAIGTVFSSVYRPTANAQASDSFSYSSDISAAKSAEYANITVTAALIGNENSIASLYGGELFVDGFRFSINSRMEGAQDNSFNLAYGFNMIGITATYSTENTYSAVIGESSISAQPLMRTVDPATIELPFDRTIYAKFSYKSGTPAAQFEADVDKYATDSAKVSATYQVTFADLPRTDEYKYFIELETHEVGDTGTVYDADLEISTVQKIVEKKIDVMTQSAISVTLGSTPDSITKQKAYANTVTNTMSADEKEQTVLAAELRDEMSAVLLPKSYEEIAASVRAGKAPLYFKIGDVIEVEYTATDFTRYTMPFNVVAFRDVTLQNGSVVPAMIIQSKYATAENIQFDAAEPTRPSSEDYSSQIANNGWARWSMSGIRQWLNSAAIKGAWWSATSAYDVAPTKLNTYNGFMRGFPTDFLSMLKPVKVETVRNYRDPDTAKSESTYQYDSTYDTFWLPSCEEEYVVPNEPNHREGLVFPWWISALSAEAAAKGESLPQQIYASASATHALASHIRYGLNAQSSGRACWLRSVNRSLSRSAWIVSASAGSIGNNSAANEAYCAPVCAIC